MATRYQIELDRNERDFATFLKSRDVSLSQSELKVLIAAKASQDHISLFDTESFRAKLNGHRLPLTNSVIKRVNKNSNR
jgi:hypothetical protein